MTADYMKTAIDLIHARTEIDATSTRFGYEDIEWAMTTANLERIATAIENLLDPSNGILHILGDMNRNLIAINEQLARIANHAQYKGA